MRTIMAGHSHRVPQTRTGGLVVVLVVGLVVCATRAATPPSTQPASGTDGAFLPDSQTHKAATSNGAGFDPDAGQTINAVEPTPGPLQLSLTGTYYYGSVSGNVQIPLGGKAGSTTPNRPHMSEIGIDTANIGDGELTVRYNPYGEFFGSAQIIHLSGSDTLHKNLVSHGISFPKGTHVTSDLQLDWYRFGYRYPFVISTAQNGIPDLTLTPWVAGIIWDFDYSLHGHKVGTASRSFAEPGIQLGGTLAWRPNGGPLSLEASLGTFPPVTGLATISVESLTARYRFYQWRQFDFTASLGVAWEQQEFKDSQHTPNHITADLGTMVSAGLGVQF